MKYRYVLFDLDGTLIDPRIGITKSVAYALTKMGINESEEGSLLRFIGPPLKDSFVEFYQQSEEQAEQCIFWYREYFSEKGIFENTLYPGIESLLDSLCCAGAQLSVATSKPTVYAEKIIEYHRLQKFFRYVIGSNLDGTRVRKTEVIDAALKAEAASMKDRVVMIGDRKHDILGAKESGIDSIGVTYGYGTFEELKAVGATQIVRNVEELARELLKRQSSKMKRMYTSKN